MTLDLLHNKIIKETLTEGFEKSVNDNLIPKLYALYGASLEGVQFYEDYINDEFIKDGYWYYPLTVVIGGIHAVVWVKWDISVAEEFEGGVPYAYVGNGGIDFVLANDVPIAFKNAIEGRSNYFEGGCVKLNVATDAPNVKILAGKYSQTFVDEMTRQLTGAISRACGVKGLPESSIELDIVFAPNTYMEHTSENVTYRRLLISAKGCSARDFWIKWTRKNSLLAYSVNDNVTSEDIVFELGEDVSQKIREKEYRFLVYGNSDKYRLAMGRKNVTEWRELIKRAVKRGELLKTTAELEEDAHVAEVSDKLSEILEKCGVSVPAATSSEIHVDAEVANEALRLAVLGNGGAESENYVPEISTAEDLAPQALEVISEAATFEESESLNGEDAPSVSVEAEDEINEDTLLTVEADGEKEEISILDSLPEDGFGEFDFGKSTDTFSTELDSGEELSFEDILEEFIPKTEDEEDSEEYNASELAADSVDISDIDESEPVLLNIDKTNDVPFEVDEEYASTTDEKNEIEPYEITDEEAEAEDEPLKAEATNAEQPSNTDIYNEIQEMEEKTSLEEETLEREMAAPVLEGRIVAELENEIESLKRELEAVTAAKRELEGELTLERDARATAEEKLNSLEILKNSAESQMNLELTAAQELRAQNEKQKFAIEQVKKLLEEEIAARTAAEGELEMLRTESELIRSENEELKEAARIAEEACRVAEEMCKHHERELLNQIELVEKEKVREKNLFAEAARQAKEENAERLAELKEAEIARIEEEARIEALRRAEDERLRLQDELRLASERSAESVYYNAEAEAEKRKRELESRAREARIRMEEKARLNAEAKASTSSEYRTTAVPVYENITPVESETVCDFTSEAEVASDVADTVTAVAEEPVSEPTPAPVVNYTYKSYIVRLMFRRSADPNVTARIHEMISYALTELGKDHVYMKVKASMPDNYTVVLNFVKFPEEEFNLLVEIINYLGKSDLGVYKVVLD